MTDLITTTNNNLTDWFTPVSEEVSSDILGALPVSGYKPSPFRVIKTSGNSFFTWFKPNAEVAAGATQIPEIQDGIVGLKGYIIHYGARLSLFDSENKKQICSSVSSQLKVGSQTVANKNSYPLPASVYGPVGYSDDRTAPAVPSAIIESFRLQGSRGQSCVDCVLKAEHVNNYTDAKGAIKQDVCSATNKITMLVTEFATVEFDDNGRTKTVWYKPQDYKNRKGQVVIEGPFIAELMVGKGQASKRIGNNFEVITEPHSYVPTKTQTWGSYIATLQATNKLRVVKMNDTSLLNCEYAILPNVATTVWAAQVPDNHRNEMIKCWPTFEDVILSVEMLNEYIKAALSIYSSELAGIPSKVQEPKELAPEVKSEAKKKSPGVAAFEEGLDSIDVEYEEQDEELDEPVNERPTQLADLFSRKNK